MNTVAPVEETTGAQEIALADLLVNDFEWLIQEVTRSMLPQYEVLHHREVYTPLRTINEAKAHPRPLNREQWNAITALLEMLWAARDEMVKDGTTARTIDAAYVPDSMLRDVVERFYYQLAEQLEKASEPVYVKGGMSAEAFDQYTEAYHQNWEQSRAQAREQAIQHPAYAELTRRDYWRYNRTHF